MDSDAIARIDAYRARKVGEILVSRAAEEFQIPPEVLVDLGALNPEEIFRRTSEKRAKFASAPFDPEGQRLRFYPGGITIWSGFPGAGKTTMLRQFVCHTLKRGSSIFLASLEEDPEEALVDLAATAAGTTEVTAEHLDWFLHEYQKRFRLWGLISVTRHLELLAVIRQLATQGIRHAIIDSLMLLDVPNDDFEAQRKFATLLSATAKASKVHIHLVAHPRKLISTEQEPDLNDVAGARELGGVADNVIFIRRAKDKGGYGPDSTVTKMAIRICKQRHYRGALCDIEGVFHRSFCQFLPDEWGSPIRYLPDGAYA